MFISLALASSLAINQPNCNNPSPCNDPPSRNSCWYCVQCRIQSCRALHPDDEVAREACREAAMIEYRWCLEQTVAPRTPAPRTDLSGDGQVTGIDFSLGTDKLLSGEWDQGRFFEFISDFFRGEP